MSVPWSSRAAQPCRPRAAADCSAVRDREEPAPHPGDIPARATLPPAKQQKLLTARLAEWKDLLRANAPKARQMLRKLIDGRIVFNPDTSTRRYRFVANGTMSQLLSGLVDPQAVASPTGTESEWIPVDAWLVSPQAEKRAARG